MRVFSFIPLVLSVAFCLPFNGQKEGLKQPVLLAHRGNSYDYPENTLLSFQSTLDLGGDGNELDVHLTKDMFVVVIHDSTVDRTTNGTGKVSEYTLSEIRSLDAGYTYTNDGGKTYPFRGTGVVVPTLVELCKQINGVLNIDIKTHSEESAQLVAKDILSVEGCSEKCIIGSFEDDTVENFKKYAPQVRTFASTREVVEFTIRFYAGRSDQHKPRSQVYDVPVGYVLDQEGYIQSANNIGQQMMFWTINNEKQIERLLLNGADGIITDNVAGAMEVFRDLGYKP